MRFLQRVLAAATMLLAAGCAQNSLPPDIAAGAKTLGIAYGLSDQVDFRRVGIMVFGNAQSFGDASAWHLDQVFLDNAKAALGSRYHIVTARIDPAAFTKLDNNFRFMTSQPSAEEYKAAFGASLPHADLWFVLRPGCMTLPNYRPGVLPCGVGVYRPEGGLSFLPVSAGIWAGLGIYDGTSFAPLGGVPLAVMRPDCPLEQPDLVVNALAGALSAKHEHPCPPSVGLDGRWYINDWAATTSAQRDAIGLSYRGMLADAVVPTLKAAHLTE